MSENQRPAPVPRARPAPAGAEEVREAPKAPKTHLVHVDLGSSTDHMTINGIEYYHGHTYNVPDHLLASFNEIMWNTRMHEEVVRGLAGPGGHKIQPTRRLY